MKIINVHFSIWINTEVKGKKFNNCEEAEALLKELTDLIKSKGYNMNPEMCSPNPSLYITKG